ncbi:hypothetical protein CYMTET_33044 [Cymbomonas tetramitiformis]|uniref:Uncharacterized protein n=1 Tax=Cymbomonas tetramitiformis TaxID=36881 RepID=A0AAE0KRL5_9CHLO|nr:hypothetical protein CYMTET_33044 [Cymbomonas tetramitiformis]
MEGPHLSLRLELSGPSRVASADLGSGALAAGQSGGEEAVGMAGGGVQGVALGTAAVAAEHGADAADVGGVVEPPRPLEGVLGGASGSAQLEGGGGRKGRGGQVVWFARLRGETAVGAGAIHSRRGRRRDSTGARAWWATRMGLERRGGHGCED